MADLRLLSSVSSSILRCTRLDWLSRVSSSTRRSSVRSCSSWLIFSASRLWRLRSRWMVCSYSWNMFCSFTMLTESSAPRERDGERYKGRQEVSEEWTGIMRMGCPKYCVCVVYFKNSIHTAFLSDLPLYLWRWNQVFGWAETHGGIQMMGSLTPQ